MKYLFLIAAIVYSMAAISQVTKVSLQASGLTCSMCSNAINKALKSVDFVDKIVPNIKTSNFDITFKPGSKIDFDKLKKKVEDAGFFVSRFIATVHFDNVQAKGGGVLRVGDQAFQLINAKDLVLDGDKNLKIIDKGFVSAKEYKKNAVLLENVKGATIYHAVI